MNLLTMQKAAFDGQILNIAYSGIGITHCPTNTMEHFLTACKLGFNTLKGDICPTLDGGLIMCHDKGYTLNEQGRIVRFDKDNCRLISQMTTEEVLALEHEAFHEELGHYAHPCTLEQFVFICKEHGMICYPTIRDENMEVVVPALLSVLDKYHMRSCTIINSMKYSSLEMVRNFDRDIMLCFTLRGGELFTKEHVDKVILLGNAMLDGFHFRDRCTSKESFGLIEEGREALAYAKANDIRLCEAQVRTYRDYYKAIQMGINGFHIKNPILPYRPFVYTFEIVIAEGEVTFENTFSVGNRYTAEVVCVPGKVKDCRDEVIVKNITLDGSDRGFADGIMPVWMEALPCELKVDCNNHKRVKISYSNEDFGIHITGLNLNTADKLRVSVMV